RAHELLALGRIGDVHGDRPRLAAGLTDRRHGRLERARQLVLALPERARGADHPAALGREEARDLRADAARGAGHHHHLAVELSHVCERLPRGPSTAAAHSRTAAHEYRHRAGHASRAGGGGPRGEFPAMPQGNARWRGRLATSTLTTSSREGASWRSCGAGGSRPETSWFSGRRSRRATRSRTASVTSTS